MSTLEQTLPVGRARNRYAWWAARGRTATLLVIMTIIAIVMFYPFLWLVFSSFKTKADIVALPIHLLPARWVTDGYQVVWSQTSLGRAYVNSIVLCIMACASVLFTSSLGGYAFARLSFPGNRLLFYFILSTTMVPGLTLLIPLYLVVQHLGLLNTYIGVWLPGAVSSFGIFLSRQFIYTVPRDLYESAKIDGCGDWGIYWRIILPLIKPVLSLLAITTFLTSFNNYLWPLIVLTNQDLYTLPLILVQISSTFGALNYQVIMAGAVLASLPTIVVYLIFQRNFVQGIALSGIKV
jgi:ABC-type glycerol-3-phosphate transport system permease component